MNSFFHEDFFLGTQTAKTLYFDYAAKVPVLDYHCHIDPKEIYENRRYENITQIWLGGDHYKWRLMRANGIDEKYISGDAPDKEKFCRWAQTLGKAIGNPLYIWSHMELLRYFDYNGTLNKDTAEEVWEICNRKLQDPSMHVRNIIEKSGITHICTTDDPIDSLEWHRKIAEDDSFSVTVLPAWRPGMAMNIESPGYLSYLSMLSDVSGVPVSSFAQLQEALRIRMNFFDSLGCKISDHALEYVMYEPASAQEIEDIFSKRREGVVLSRKDQLKFKSAFMLFSGREYRRLDWAMQLHYGCKRDNRSLMFDRLGPDTGYDCINNYAPADQMADFLNALDITDELPRTIIYSLNPQDNQTIQTIIGCFQDSSVINKLQHGSPWWFNDHKAGIVDQLTSLGNIGLLAGHLGMLTDSRSFLSYPRHEYFRRILCNLFGTWVENGEFPKDMDTLGSIVQDISYYNAMRYFKFN